MNIRRFYVYGWYDKDRLFYIGKGQKDRKHAFHFNERAVCGIQTKAPARCEVIRSYAGNDFNVRVIKEALTEDEALDLEAEMIFDLKPWGNKRGKHEHLRPESVLPS